MVSMPRCGCPREARQVVVRVVVAEVVEEQERIEVGGIGRSRRPAESHSGASMVGSLLRLDGSIDMAASELQSTICRGSSSA